MTADEIIAYLGMKPHPEGGHYVETFRAPGEGRSSGTAIYFLLKAGERSHWHRVDADEIWHHYAGAPLELSMSDDGKNVRHLRLGTDFGVGEQPQAVVPRHVWQAARSLGAWTLVGCTVSPGFEFKGFEMAPLSWHPGPVADSTSMLRIYFDGNDATPDGRYGLWVQGSLDDIAPVADQLRDGMRVIIYMTGELEMQAVLAFDKQWNAWTAWPVPGTIKYYDEDSGVPELA